MAKTAAYKTIQDDILRKIESGEYRPGTRLPTEAELILRYSVSRITVQRALNELKSQGIISRRPRSGSFVRAAGARRPEAPASPRFASRTADRVTLGVVAPFDMADTVIYQYLPGIMSALDPTRVSLQLHNTGYDAANERKMLENCLADGCDGILYYPGLDPAPPLDLLIQIRVAGYPCVLIDKALPQVPLPSVLTDNVAAGREITEELLGAGHRKIAFLRGGFESSVCDRYLGFCQAMRAAGLSGLDRMCYSIMDYHDGRSLPELARQMAREGVTAICCCADLYAKWFMDACRSADIRVPEDIAIGSFDGSYPGVITSMLQPYRQIGRTATEMLLKWIEGGEAPQGSMAYPATLLKGSTI